MLDFILLMIVPLLVAVGRLCFSKAGLLCQSFSLQYAILTSDKTETDFGRHKAEALDLRHRK